MTTDELMAIAREAARVLRGLTCCEAVRAFAGAA